MLVVHEGSVVLANEDGALEVNAGDKARARPGSAPQHDPTRATRRRKSTEQQDTVLAKLRAKDAAQQRRIAQLERELGHHQPDAPPAPDDPARRCATSYHAPGCDDVDPPPEVLEEMARCGSIKVDPPEFLLSNTADGYTPSAALTSLVNLTDDEVATVTEANRRFAEAYAAELKQIVKELGGNAPEMPADTPPWAIISSFSAVLDGAVPDEEATRIRQSIAQERASLASAPADRSALPPHERYERLRADVADNYEAALSTVLGSDRAHELRVARNGWGGSATLFGGRCPDDPPDDE